MKLREFLQEILPTEVDYSFLPDDLAEMEVVIDLEGKLWTTNKVERNFPDKQLIIHSQF